jgi:Beta-ketoacyl synthase, C-terminal domain
MFSQHACITYDAPSISACIISAHRCSHTGICALPQHSSAQPCHELGHLHQCRTALQSAHLGAAEVAYVAVHGTGTPLGDPIEVGALGAALGGKGGGGGRILAPLVIGSSKVTPKDGLEVHELNVAFCITWKCKAWRHWSSDPAR